MTLSHVFDTYATTLKGKIMHFDVILDDNNSDSALQYAQQWLQSIGEEDATLTQNNCIYCHSAEAPPEFRAQINQRGFAIMKLEGCPP